MAAENTASSPPQSEATTFWAAVKKRRNQFFLTWIGWLPAGLILVTLYGLFLPDTEIGTNIAGFLALATWGAFWHHVGRRLWTMPCYKCGKRAIAHPYFFMRHAKCINCGTTPHDA